MHAFSERTNLQQCTRYNIEHVSCKELSLLGIDTNCSSFKYADAVLGADDVKSRKNRNIINTTSKVHLIPLSFACSRDISFLPLCNNV